MFILDDKKIFAKSEIAPVALANNLLGQQLIGGFNCVSRARWPKNYKDFKEVVVCGMGGSNLASEFLRDVFVAQLKAPVILTRGYDLPAFVGPKTLVIISSYSGETEETLSCLKQAIAKKLKVFCVSAGGSLLSVASAKKLPFCRLEEKLNPSGQPRYGLGLQLGALMAIFSFAGLIELSQKDLMKEWRQALAATVSANKVFGLSSATAKNPAKQLAKKLYGYAPVVAAAEFLSADAHILTNQINESAKNIAFYQLLPELNHHLLDSFALPAKSAKQIKFLFLTSDSYHPRVAKRFAITAKALAKAGVTSASFKVRHAGPLAEALSMLVFCSWLSFYLAVLNKKNPAAVPLVNYLKQELKK